MYTPEITREYSLVDRYIYSTQVSCKKGPYNITSNFVSLPKSHGCHPSFGSGDVYKKTMDERRSISREVRDPQHFHENSTFQHITQTQDDVVSEYLNTPNFVFCVAIWSIDPLSDPTVYVYKMPPLQCCLPC
jgi:hypothetical protein